MGSKPPLHDDDALVQAVVDVVRDHHGICRSALYARLRGKGARRRLAIAAALTSGHIHEATICHPARGGSRRSGRGLFPGPVPPDAPPPVLLSASELRELRLSAGVGQAELADSLGVSRCLIVHWEQSRQPIPAWRSGAIHGALLRAERERIPRGIDVTEHAVLAEVAAKPGITMKALLGQVDANRWAVVAAVARARSAGRLYGGQSLYPGSPPAPLPAERIRSLRREAGWTLEEVGRRVGVHPTVIYGWEHGRLVVPEHRRARLRQVLEVEGRRVRGERKAAILAAIERRPGISNKELTREVFDRRAFTAELVAELVAEDRIHEGSGTVLNAQGIGRAMRGFWPGPVPATVTRLHALELQEGRRRVGWSQRDLGQRLGTSKTQIGHWERGRQPIPLARAAEIRRLFANAAPAPEARADPVRSTDVELEAAALAIVRTDPGLPRTGVVRRMPGDVRRRWAALERLLDRGLLHLRTEAVPDRAGRLRRRAALYLSPPGAVSGPTVKRPRRGSAGQG